uniref:Mitochondrial import inner membrane translocase subunit Tim21 n=1 Tax=Strix occidentalis caurina TaxID=311401 RepID=A0A8D0FQU7_STROC
DGCHFRWSHFNEKCALKKVCGKKTPQLHEKWLLKFPHCRLIQEHLYKKVLLSKIVTPVLFLSISVKEAGRDFTYFIVVLVGIGVTGGLFYVIFKELFSSSSPSKIYGDALEKCRSHPEIIGVFGESIKGYGEATRRGRRQLVSHIEYVKDGLKHMRLKFYIEGSEPGKRGTVHVEVKENPERGKFEFRYIFVDVDTYPRRTIVIEDNR